MKGTKERIAKLENNKRDIVKYEQRGLALKTHENQTKTKQAETKISLRGRVRCHRSFTICDIRLSEAGKERTELKKYLEN